MRKILCSFIAIMAFFGGIAQAASMQSLATVKQTARDFALRQIPHDINGKLKVTMGHLDPRLRLAACAQDLEAFLPPSSAVLTTHIIGVRCKGQKPWSIFVPITIKIFKPVVVAAVPIARGEILTEAHIAMREMDVKRLQRSYLQGPKTIIGKVATRQIRAGTPIAAKFLQYPRVIKRGEIVTISAEYNNVRVRMPGIALMDGRQGQMIQIRNQRSKRLVEARVVGPGQVKVNL